MLRCDELVLGQRKCHGRFVCECQLAPADATLGPRCSPDGFLELDWARTGSVRVTSNGRARRPRMAVPFILMLPSAPSWMSPIRRSSLNSLRALSRMCRFRRKVAAGQRDETTTNHPRHRSGLIASIGLAIHPPFEGGVLAESGHWIFLSSDDSG